MARRVEVAAEFSKTPKQPPAEETPPAPTKKAPARKKATTPSPRKKSATSSSTRARKTAAAAAPQPAPTPEPEASSVEIRVKATDAKEAKRVSLYLHPDDYKALALAKLEDGADLNSRVRAMIAVWQGNSRVRAQVDRLASTAPRGGGY